MFVGHGLLAFAVVGWVAGRRRPVHEALALAVLAAAFATLPDLDMLYAPVGALTAEASSPVGVAESFWATGNRVHRSVTHSVLLAPALAVAGATLLAARRKTASRRRRTAAALAGGIVVALTAVATAASGWLGGTVLAACGVGALGIADLAARYTGVRPAELFAVALFGLVSHPFGDLLTGEPPALLYPLAIDVIPERVVLSGDPTVHLLGAFGVELAALWLGFGVLLWLLGERPTIAPRAALGLGYAASVLLIPAPTLELSYPFVFSVLGVGLVAALPVGRPADPDDDPVRADPGLGGTTRGSVGAGPRLPSVVGRIDATDSVATALSAVTLAWLAYGLAYLAL